MEKRICNKLVRDLVPNSIKQNNQTPEIITLDDKQYTIGLAKKLSEEAKEVSEESN